MLKELFASCRFTRVRFTRIATVTLADASIVQIENCLYSCIDVISGKRDGGMVGCGRKNWLRGILRAILGQVHTKTCSDECTPSSSWRVPRVISKEDGIRKRGGRSSRIASNSTARRRAKGLKRGERAETLTLLRETLPEHSYTACNEQAEKQ